LLIVSLEKVRLNLKDLKSMFLKQQKVSVELFVIECFLNTHGQVLRNTFILYINTSLISLLTFIYLMRAFKLLKTLRN